jgi:hypothetical protein
MPLAKRLIKLFMALLSQLLEDALVSLLYDREATFFISVVAALPR